MEFHAYDLVELLEDQENGVRRGSGGLITAVDAQAGTCEVEVLGINGAPSMMCTVPVSALRLVRRANREIYPRKIPAGSGQPVRSALMAAALLGMVCRRAFRTKPRRPTDGQAAQLRCGGWSCPSTGRRSASPPWGRTARPTPDSREVRERSLTFLPAGAAGAKRAGIFS